MLIGMTDGHGVYWNKSDATVIIRGTNVMIVGVSTLEKALERCAVNLKGFYPNPRLIKR